MHSRIAIALLAALPLSVAHAVAGLQYKEIQLRQVTQVPGAAATTNPAAGAVPSSADLFTECIPPSTLYTFSPTNFPTMPSAIESALATVTDPCGSFSLPQSLSAAWISYSSAAASWAKANEPALSSQDAAISSFEASLKSNPVCASLYPSTSAVTGTTNLGVCTAVSTGAGGSATVSSSGSSSSGGSSKSSASNNPATSRETTMLVVGTFLAACLAAVVAL